MKKLSFKSRRRNQNNTGSLFKTLLVRYLFYQNLYFKAKNFTTRLQINNEDNT